MTRESLDTMEPLPWLWSFAHEVLGWELVALDCSTGIKMRRLCRLGDRWRVKGRTGRWRWVLPASTALRVHINDYGTTELIPLTPGAKAAFAEMSR